MTGWWRLLLGGRPEDDEILGINRRNIDLVFADYRPGRFRTLDDKLESKKLLEKAGIAVPQTLNVIDDGNLDDLPALLDPHDAFALKPARGWGGRGILVLEREGDAWLKPGGEKLDLQAVADHVADVLTGVHSLDEARDLVIVEERLVPHRFYAELAPAGLCDLRIVVEKGVPVQAMVRVPTAASDGKANLHGGGMGLGIDLATGRVTGAIVGDKPAEHHPDTGHRVVGLTLPDWSTCLDLAVKAAGATGIDYVGVDLVVDHERGPLVLEVNARPGLAIQMANRAGQPITTRVRESGLDRTAIAVNKVLMAALIAAPLLFHWWQGGHAEMIIVDVADRSVRSAVDDRVDVESREPESFDEDAAVESDLDDVDSVFPEALAATAAGDTATAVAAYRSAVADSGLAPFALNNLALIARRSGRDEEALDLLTEAVTRFPAYARGHYNRGLVLRDLGRIRDAEDALLHGLELRPNHARAWTTLGRIYYMEQRYEEAVDAFQRAVRYDPAARSARFWWGLALRLMGSLEEGRRVLADLAAIDPGHEGAAYWLVRTRRDLVHIGQRPIEGLRECRSILEPHLASSPRCRSISAILAVEAGDPGAAIPLFQDLAKSTYRPVYHLRALAATTLGIGMWDGAAGVVDDIREADPRGAAALKAWTGVGSSLAGTRPPAPGPDAPAMVRLAVAAMNGDILAARRQAEALPPSRWTAWLSVADPAAGSGLRIPVDLEPFARPAGDVDAWVEQFEKPPLALLLYLGGVLADRRGQDDLARDFRLALARAEPWFVPVLLEEFRSAAASGNLEAAREPGQEIYDLGHRDPLFLLEFAQVQLDLGSERLARRLLGRLPGRVRDDPRARYLEGRLAMADGRPQDGVKILEEVARKMPDDVAVMLALGVAYREAGHMRRSQDTLQRARNLDAAHPDVLRALAVTLMERRRYEEAVKAWDEFLSLAPGDVSALFNRALALQRSGNEIAALAGYEAVLARDPGGTAARYNRGLALMRLGRSDEAVEAFRRVLEIKPDHAGSLARLAELEGRRP